MLPSLPAPPSPRQLDVTSSVWHSEFQRLTPTSRAQVRLLDCGWCVWSFVPIYGRTGLVHCARSARARRESLHTPHTQKKRVACNARLGAHSATWAGADLI